MPLIKELFIRSYKPSNGFIPRIEEMFKTLKRGAPEVQPSKYWEELNRMNIEQLKKDGYENFKRTIALNHFTWTRLTPWNSQLRFLYKSLSLKVIVSCLARSFKIHDFYSVFNIPQSLAYNFLTLLEWEYIKNLEGTSLEEPKYGNPLLIKGRSQDLANSLLEFDSYKKYVKGTVLELGGGYGRTAFVNMKLRAIKYIFVDIPPSIWVAEKYLSSCFPEKVIYTVKDNFDQKSFDKADLVFLLPSQLHYLKSGSVDFILTISSLHEMRIEQINYYLSVFKSLLKIGGHFYLKQWKEGKVLFENVTIYERDYKVPLKKLFSRTARVQTKFFEALYMK